MPHPVIDTLLAALDTVEDAPVRQVLVGAHATLVCARRCGLASTVIGERPHDRLVRDAGRLHTKTARALAEYLRSDDPLEASVGMAALNSLLPVDPEHLVEMNAFDLIVREGAGRTVALVGGFPFVPRLRPLVGDLKVLELRPAANEYPADAAGDIIPGADVVALTGTTLINHTFDGLVSLARPGAFVIVLGPSTPLSPVLFEHGVSAVGGRWSSTSRRRGRRWRRGRRSGRWRG